MTPREQKQAEWRKNHPERLKAYNSNWYTANRDKAKARSDRYAKANPDKIRSRKLRRDYGISIEDYDRMLTLQNGVCAVCSEPPSKANAREMVLHVDHCHKTGKIRGLLCATCNRMLGLAKDNPETLIKAATYVKETT